MENQKLKYRVFYGNDGNFLTSQKQRFAELVALFQQTVNRDDPTLFRAPGRVNLIGEHTDYNGYPVLPLAINRDILAAIHKREDNTVSLTNVDPQFEKRQFAINGPPEPYETGDWGNYVKAAVAGLYPMVEAKRSPVKGFDAVFSGSIPFAAGLSSSSALVVVSALIFMWVNGIEKTKMELAELLARAERFVGTEGGGMDQAISLMGERAKALKIDFFPLRVKQVKMPNDYHVVIANSLIKAPKTEEAMNEYNRRAIECRLAAALIEKELIEAEVVPEDACRLADVKWQHILSKIDYDRMVARALELGNFNLNELLTKLELSEKAFREDFLTLRSGAIFEPPAEGFKIKQRYQHVVSEAERVEEASFCLEKGDTEGVGQLMNASHESCADSYEISTKELDELVAIARNHGSIGSRLTGAGFGGCTVSLVHKDLVNALVEGIKSDYYLGYLKEHRPDITVTAEMLQDCVFATPAVDGACKMTE